MAENRNSAPIFIVGYMHSGTTLLHNILRANPTIFSAADETRYFGYLPLLQQLYPDLDCDSTLSNLITMLVDLIEHGNPARLRSAPRQYRPDTALLNDAERVVILNHAQQDLDYGAVFRVVFDFLAHRTGKTRWLEKTPQHVFLIDEILHSIPNALFVEIVRDPRDILASKKRRKNGVRNLTQRDPEEKRLRALERVYDPFWESLEWRLALRAGQRAHATYPKRICSIRYEDLVTDPEATIRLVCEFLELEYVPDMLDVSWWNAAEGDRSERRGFVPENIGRWTQSLNSAEVALCQWMGRGQMERAGYPLAPVSIWGRLGIPWLFLRAGWGLTDRLIRRWRLGGFKFLMNTLKNYWGELRKFRACL